MNDSESALLQSSLALVKQRFQAIVGGSPSKAWLLQVHDRESGGTSPIYALADGYESPGVESKPSTWARLGCPAIGLGVPRFWRTVRLNGSEILTPIGKEAAELLMSLPVAVQSRLWRGLPAGTNLRTAEGDLLWALAVFELANANIAYSSLRAVRQTPLTEETAKAFFAPESKLPADSDWYATLPNFAAASVQAIDILQSWLADELKRETEATSKPPETAETIQRRLQEIVKNCQEEHHLRVRLCMEAFPDLRTGLAKWEWDDHKGDCPEWQLANERLLKRFGAIDGEPARWGLRLRPPIMCVRWDEDAAIDLGRAIRDDLFDAARSAVADQPVMVATPTAPKGEGPPVEPQAGTLAGGDGAGGGGGEAVGGQGKSAAIAALVRVPTLSEKQYLILEAMKELATLSADTRRSAQDIAVACDGKKADVNVFKPLLSDLTKNHKLTESKTGRGGGSWLNDRGVEVANRLVENRKASASKR